MVLTLENYRYDADRCLGCGGCRWVDHIYMKGPEVGIRCPSSDRYLYLAYSAHGRLKIALALMDGKLTYSPTIEDVIFKCQLCGACDAGCKRNLDLEPLLVLEALRERYVRDKGPLPAHKAIADNITKHQNRYGESHQDRFDWLPSDVQPAEKADIVYFAGCNSAYRQKELAQATVRILKAAKVDFMVMEPFEWCCGHPLYVTGQADLAKLQVEHNLAAIKESGAKTVVASCAECYKTLKVDYPKMLGKSTADMGFRVVHIVELANQLMKDGALKPVNRVDLRVTYHDPCNLSRMSEPWIHWEGKRGKYGTLEPPKEYRRGTNGVYYPPRDILRSIPGVEVVEMDRIRENAWCCGADGGVRDAFKDFALWTAGERLNEAKRAGAEAIVSCCPHCKENFRDAATARKDKIAVYDITEMILKAIRQ